MNSADRPDAAPPDTDDALERNVALYPWFKFCQSLLFWQAVWFLYFQSNLSAGAAIVLYAVYDVATTLLEVPSGYMSDRLGRRRTLIAAAVAGAAGAVLLAVGGGFGMFVGGQVLLGAAAAFASGTDSAMLYESLAGLGREDETEAQEVRAWRFGFVALALSATVGGAVALWSAPLTFAGGAVAMSGALIVVLRMTEPPQERAEMSGAATLAALRATLREPVLLWLFGLAMVMYGFSHIPFVFGQPFIAEALEGLGMATEAPLVSGIVTTVMMVLSLAASLAAPALRHRMGLSGILLLAFGMQIALIGTLALTNNALAIALLFLRMVPDALSRPFMLARIQPLLRDATRATYMSLQSLAGRLVFACALLVASGVASDRARMAYAEIQTVLGGFVAVGLIAFALLWLTARRARVAAAGQGPG